MNLQSYEVAGKHFEIYRLGEIVDSAICAGVYPAIQIHDHLSKLKSEKLVVIDVGANAGSVSIPLGVLLRDRITVYAFEPHPVIYDLLVKNIEKYNLQGIVIPFNLAVGSEQLYIRKELNPGNTGTSNTYTADAYYNGIKVNCIKLDDVLSTNGIEKVDVIKVDVEGGEYRIFSEFNMWDKIDMYHVELHDVYSYRVEDVRKYGLYDKHLGPCCALRRFMLEKLNLEYENKHTRLFKIPMY